MSRVLSRKDGGCHLLCGRDEEAEKGMLKALCQIGCAYRIPCGVGGMNLEYLAADSDSDSDSDSSDFEASSEYCSKSDSDVEAEAEV